MEGCRGTWKSLWQVSKMYGITKASRNDAIRYTANRKLERLNTSAALGRVDGVRDKVR